MTAKCANIKPMAKWLEEPEQPGDCKPCRIAGILGDYQKVLQDNGHENYSDDITAKLESTDDPDPIMSIAKAMDSAKEQVPEAVRNELLELDCLAQTEPINA